jgi:hypothetical protein
MVGRVNSRNSIPPVNRRHFRDAPIRPEDQLNETCIGVTLMYV